MTLCGNPNESICENIQRPVSELYTAEPLSSQADQRIIIYTCTDFENVHPNSKARRSQKKGKDKLMQYLKNGRYLARTRYDCVN